MQVARVAGLRVASVPVADALRSVRVEADKPRRMVLAGLPARWEPYAPGRHVGVAEWDGDDATLPFHHDLDGPLAAAADHLSSQMGDALYELSVDRQLELIREEAARFAPAAGMAVVSAGPNVAVTTALPPAPPPPVEIAAAAVHTSTPGSVSRAEVEQLLASRDAAWRGQIEQLTSVFSAALKAMHSDRPGRGRVRSLRASYDNQDRVTEIVPVYEHD